MENIVEGNDSNNKAYLPFGKVFIGTKIIRAEPMSNEIWLHSHNKWNEGQETLGEGYKVLYEDGYYSWSPKRSV